jgi:hypothetical protein
MSRCHVRQQDDIEQRRQGAHGLHHAVHRAQRVEAAAEFFEQRLGLVIAKRAAIFLPAHISQKIVAAEIEKEIARRQKFVEAVGEQKDHFVDVGDQKRARRRHRHVRRIHVEIRHAPLPPGFSRAI